ncbi:putative siderophore esterase IroE-like protein [Aureobasidium subglaciale]|nr:putative siderophore esterase IroE-like protein [Aureobasidium subglaciale]
MSTGSGTPITLPSATQYDLTNPTTGLNYRIQISWPINWTRTKQLRASKIPVLYILDGNALFLNASEILWRSASNSFYHGGGIVVGIGYQDVPTHTGSLFSGQRNTDLTLTEHDVHVGLGGADAFLEFIGREVRSLVKRQFEDVEIGEEAIFGHSFGGLCVLHALFGKKGGVFDAYFAASPSVWWDSKIFDEAEEFCSGEEKELKCSLQISYGGFEAKPQRTPSESETEFAEREKRCAERKMGANAVAMEKRLRESGKLKDTSIIKFEQEDHGTVATSAVLRALIESKWLTQLVSAISQPLAGRIDSLVLLEVEACA